MEDLENENDSNRTKSRSPSPGVKSTAVVKYTAFQTPVSYARLQCNTDLNMPPSNWGAAIDSYGLKQILTGSTGLSSFRMAHMFPDSVGEVDVISGAECIKKLLKLPYQPNGTVSMIVHRIENTLLLDDFDVYDYLMKSEWSWLKDFFYENILKTMSEQERTQLTLPPPVSSARQLTQAFLTHSVAQRPPPSPQPAPGTCASVYTARPFLPEPETKPEPLNEEPKEHLYNRNVLWTFEDIQMLIGSDLPIFGDKDRPCVSLRLRDAREPINVLTGIDYWLDNLMCNVPEVLMCYHLDGIVQKYEPMKTEDLPNMENSKFSPKVIRNVAQNILSFLKSNATKAGHTYWLFKGPHDDVVKLYDLTSLCPDSVDNPFTTPVAMLLYRVARNVRMTNRSRHVKQLLEHAISLLQEARHPHIVASAHYMLADLYLPAETDPACPDFKEDNSESDGEEEYVGGDFAPESEPGQETSVQVAEDQSSGDHALALQITGLQLRDIGNRVRDDTERDRIGGKTTGKGSLGTDPPQRCGRALTHALSGLQALHHVTLNTCKEEERERLKQQVLIEEQHPKMANPSEPIKMNYEPLQKQTEPKEHTSRSRRRKRDKKNKEVEAEKTIIETPGVDKNAIQILKEKKIYPTWHEPNRNDNFAWKLHLKTLLYEKICLAYSTLAEYSYANEQYGFSLKYIDLASKCQKLLSNMIIRSKVVDASCLLGRLGDNYFQLSKNWHRLEQFKKQFETDHDVDRKIRMEIESDMEEEIEGDNTAGAFDLDVCIPSSIVSAMETACSVYSMAEGCERARRAELLRRRASVRNELAVRHMHDAQQIFMKYQDEPNLKDPKAQQLLEQFTTIARKSLECLTEATDIFCKVNDLPNLALLLCNKGRYLRFRAHCDMGGFGPEKRRLYAEAECLYVEALKVLGPRETCEVSSVWELVAWELSCHTYTKAVLMQDEPHVYSADATEVAEALNHALKQCLLSPGPRQYLYQFRAAMIHHRLGSLHHSQYRATQEEGPRRRALLAATRAQYEQAARGFATLEDAAMFLTAQAEHVAALEAQANLSPNLKLKSLQSALQLLRQCHSVMLLLKDRDPEDQKDAPKEEADEKTIKNEHSLLSLFENRLHFILKSIIQYCRSKSNKDYEKITDLHKKLYCASLKIKKDEDVRMYASSICDVLAAMDEISKEYE